MDSSPFSDAPTSLLEIPGRRREALHEALQIPSTITTPSAEVAGRIL